MLGDPLPVCNVPPPGWSCSRGAGHEGPCAASPVSVQSHDLADHLLSERHNQVMAELREAVRNLGRPLSREEAEELTRVVSGAQHPIAVGIAVEEVGTDNPDLVELD